MSYSPEYGSSIGTTKCELQSRVWFVDRDNQVVSYSPEYGSSIGTTKCELQSRVWFVDRDNQV